MKEIEMTVVNYNKGYIKGAALLKLEGADEGITYKLDISMPVKDADIFREDFGLSDTVLGCLLVLKKQIAQRKIDDFTKEKPESKDDDEVNDDS